jgi:hypothetical protein
MWKKFWCFHYWTTQNILRQPVNKAYHNSENTILTVVPKEVRDEIWGLASVIFKKIFQEGELIENLTKFMI